MNKNELISAVAEKTGLTKKDTEAVISATFEAITEGLVAGEKVNVVGFGIFDVRPVPSAPDTTPAPARPFPSPPPGCPSSSPARP